MLDDPPAEQLGLPVEEWAEIEGIDGWSERELQKMYVERFGGPTPGAVRHSQRWTGYQGSRLECSF